eukprot:scaffold186484_cov37-Prasinocladus_malaysianus.AAC.1
MKSSSWCVRRSGQAEALANIWEQELLKAQNERKEQLLSVMMRAMKLCRFAGSDEAESSHSNGSDGSAATLPLVDAIWVRLPRAVRLTLRHCKPGLSHDDLMKRIVDTFNATFDPRRLLGTREGESLGPLWREVEIAAKANALLPNLSVVARLWKEANGNATRFAHQMANARRIAARLDASGTSDRPSKMQHA